MRVVVDTNVFVSSFFGGRPREVIDRWHGGEFTLCLSTEIVEEYIRVLARLGLGADGELAELLDLFRSGRGSVFAANPEPVTVVQDDPDDDKFFSCALALEARLVVSGDHHLLVLDNYAGIRVLRPLEFLELLAKG